MDFPKSRWKFIIQMANFLNTSGLCLWFYILQSNLMKNLFETKNSSIVLLTKLQKDDDREISLLLAFHKKFLRQKSKYFDLPISKSFVHTHYVNLPRKLLPHNKFKRKEDRIAKRNSHRWYAHTPKKIAKTKPYDFCLRFIIFR